MNQDEIIKKCSNYEHAWHDPILRLYYNGIGNLNNLINPHILRLYYNGIGNLNNLINPHTHQSSSEEYIITEYSIKLDKYLSKKSKVFSNFIKPTKKGLGNHKFNYYIHITYVNLYKEMIYGYVGICKKCGIEIVSEYSTYTKSTKPSRFIYRNEESGCDEYLMKEALG